MSPFAFTVDNLLLLVNSIIQAMSFWYCDVLGQLGIPLSLYIYIGAGVLILLKFKHGLTQRVGLMEELYRNDLNSGSLITTRDLHMYVYICKYTYIHTYTPIHTYTYIYICTYMFIICLIHIYIYIFISVAVQMDCP